MEYLPRLLEARMRELLAHFPVVAVIGARQVGKSTLVQHLGVSGLRTVTFDPVSDVANARADPDLFLQNHPPPLFLDEAQYAPELLASLKRSVDTQPGPGRYILSGSQNLAMQRSLAESLAGRVAILHLHPLAHAELQRRVPSQGMLHQLVWHDARPSGGPTPPPTQPTYEAVFRGGFPGAQPLPMHLYGTYFDSYFQTYVEKDVRLVARIGDLHTFGRFIRLLAALTAQELNHNELGRDLGVDRKTALAWSEVAMATFQWHTVPAYTRNLVKSVAGRTKGYFCDTGFASQLLRISSPETLASHPSLGRLFETFVVLEIIKLTRAWSTQPNLWHFRAHSGAEVDLILELNGRLYPIEIKLTTKPTRRMTRGIQSLRAAAPKERFGPSLLICAVETPLPLGDDIFAIPWWAL